MPIVRPRGSRQEPRIFPVIATRNRPRALCDQIARLRPQLAKDECIYIVVDGCAETAAILADMDTAGIVRGGIEWLSLARKVGPDRARRIGNTFVPSRTHDIVCEIDDHDTAAPELLRELREVFSDPKANIAYCDVIYTDPNGKVQKVRKKEPGPCKERGFQGYGMRAYRKWLYDAVGGYPLDYFPVNDFALLCMIEQLCHFQGSVHIPKTLVTAIVDSRGVSAMHKLEQEAQFSRVQDLANNGGFKLPFKMPPPDMGGPVESVTVIQPRTMKLEGAATARGPASRQVPPGFKPHVVLVTEVVGHGRGGGEMSMLGLLRRVAEKGCRVSALYARDAGEQPYQSDWLTLHRLEDATLRDRGAMASPRFREALQALQPDIVVTEVRTGANIANACERLGVPMLTLVQFWHNIVQSNSRGFAGLLGKDRGAGVMHHYGLAQLGKSAALVANSEYTARVIKWAFGRPADAVVLPPVDAETVVPRNAPPVGMRACVTCPSVQPGKGAEIFLALARRNPDICFMLLAGDNRHSREDAIVHEAERLPNVEVRREWVSDMREVYAQTRCVFIGTQTAESFCRTAAEARANGIPLLVSDAGNLARIVDTGSGVIVPRRAAVAEWDVGLKKALMLKPKPTAEFCQDHSARFVEVIDKTRKLSEVGIFRPDAAGILTGVSQFEAVLGMRDLGWPLSATKAEQCALAIVPGIWDADFSDRYEGRLAFWWCSHFAQMDTDRREMKMLLHVTETVRNSSGDRYLLLTSKPDVAVWAKTLGGRVKWLPNCLKLAEPRRISKLDGRHVFLPGPYVQRKNIYTALAACAGAGAEAHVTARASGQCPTLQGLAQALGIRLHIHDCPDRADVLKVAGQCHAAVMVSTAETYCYAAAECVLAGTPVVGWRGVPILSQAHKVADPTDVGEVAAALRQTLDMSEELARKQRETVQHNAERMNAAARATLLGVLNA